LLDDLLWYYVIFCLSDTLKDKEMFKTKLVQHFSQQDICVLLNNSEQIKQIIRNQTALEHVRKHNLVVRQDPVEQREFKLYLANTERTFLYLLKCHLNKK
jgi:precorrin-3B methylase